MEKADNESDYIKVTHPKGETWVVFEKSVMNMYCDEASAKGLADTLNKKNVEPDTKYVVEKFTPKPESVPSCGEQEDEKEKAHYWYYLGAAEGLTHSLAGKKPEFEKAWSRFNEANQKFNR